MTSSFTIAGIDEAMEIDYSSDREFMAGLNDVRPLAKVRQLSSAYHAYHVRVARFVFLPA